MMVGLDEFYLTYFLHNLQRQSITPSKTGITNAQPYG